MSETYTEDGREFYTSADNPVWPGRHREHLDMRTGEPKGRLCDDSFTLLIMEGLDKLETMSRPSLGPEAAKSKDLDAFNALNQAAWLLEYAAKWAIDHQIGLAISDLRFLPLLPNETRELPEYQAAKAAVDTHDHERAGGAFQAQNADPVLTRRIAINILSPISAHIGLTALVDALKALETGEVLPILQPASNADKTRFTEARFQLEAVALVEYWTVLKNVKYKAQELVAEAFGVPMHTLRGWESRLRSKLGTLEVNGAVARARNCAKTFEHEDRKSKMGGKFANPENFDFSYGPRSAAAIGERYRKFLKGEGHA